MYTSFMPINIACLCRLLILQVALSPCGHATEQEEITDLNKFALNLKEIVVSRNVASFKAIGCFPVGCIDSEEISYVFGSGDDAGVIRRQFLGKEIKIKIFGSYTYEDKYENRSYSIIVYDQTLLQFKNNGTMSASDRERLWQNGYVETVVIFNRDKKKWQFHGAPFYYGAHFPWAEDYG